MEAVGLNDPVSSAPRWLTHFHRAALTASKQLGQRADVADREREAGTVGAGGDRTLEIDALAEDAVFAELDLLATAGASFTAVSEERGVVRFGPGAMRVVIDPIDGSLNAKRGLSHCSMSIAVADGPTTEDLAVAFVWDFGTGEAFHAVRGGGAFLNGTRVAPHLEERLAHDGRLELLCVETSDSRRTAALAEPLARIADRWRIFGSIAVALCQVATPRVDAMVNVTRCRIVDAAAAALIVSESGGVVRFGGGDRIPLDLDQRTWLCAARTPLVADRLVACLRADA